MNVLMCVSYWIVTATKSSSPTGKKRAHSFLSGRGHRPSVVSELSVAINVDPGSYTTLSVQRVSCMSVIALCL